jgi:uncharacterized protein YodC (DUF2158 family)
MELDETYILELLVDAAMVAERLTPSDFDERYRTDMEGGYRPEVVEAKRRYFGDPARLSLEGTMAAENEFNVGDVVMLKTGGPRMTVEGIGSALDEKAVNCVWYDGSRRVRESFDAVLLERRE